MCHPTSGALIWFPHAGQSVRRHRSLVLRRRDEALFWTGFGVAIAALITIGILIAVLFK